MWDFAQDCVQGHTEVCIASYLGRNPIHPIMKLWGHKDFFIFSLPPSSQSPLPLNSASSMLLHMWSFSDQEGKVRSVSWHIYSADSPALHWAFCIYEIMSWLWWAGRRGPVSPLPWGDGDWEGVRDDLNAPSWRVRSQDSIAEFLLSRLLFNACQLWSSPRTGLLKQVSFSEAFCRDFPRMVWKCSEVGQGAWGRLF